MPGRPWYEHHVVGTNARMTEMQAAILLVQLGRMKRHAEERLLNAAILDRAIGAYAEEFMTMRPLNADTARRAYHLYMFRYIGGGRLSGVSREDFANAMRAEGAPVNTGYDVPLYKQAMFENAPRGVQQTSAYNKMYQPNAEKAVKESLWFGQNVLVGGDGQVNDIVKAIDKIVANADELRANKRD